MCVVCTRCLAGGRGVCRVYELSCRAHLLCVQLCTTLLWSHISDECPICPISSSHPFVTFVPSCHELMNPPPTPTHLPPPTPTPRYRRKAPSSPKLWTTGAWHGRLHSRAAPRLALRFLRKYRRREAPPRFFPYVAPRFPHIYPYLYVTVLFFFFGPKAKCDCKEAKEKFLFCNEANG